MDSKKIISLRMERQFLLDKKADKEEYVSLYRVLSRDRICIGTASGNRPYCHSARISTISSTTAKDSLKDSL